MNATAKKTVKKVVKTTTIKVSDYKKQVINSNAKLKITHKTLGGCLKNMWYFADDMGLTASQKTVVKLLRGDDKAYTEFQKVCRKSKGGNYSPFFVLQAIYKASKVEAKPTKK